MSKAFAFYEWWHSQSRFGAVPSRLAAQAGWNAAIEAAAKMLESISDDFGAMGNDAMMVTVQQHADEVRALAVEEM